MATLNALLNELTEIQEAPAEFLEIVKSTVAAGGNGIYNISTEYGDFCISKDSAATLSEIRKQVQADIDADADEDDPEWDYFADFNDETVPEGFLYGEGWYCVSIYEVDPRQLQLSFEG